MVCTRLSLVEESSFDESEVGLIPLESTGTVSFWLSCFTKILPLVSIVFTSKQSGGMRVQNISRQTNFSFISLFAFVCTISLRYAEGVRSRWFSFELDELFKRISRALSFVSLIGFIGGFFREARPEFIAAQTRPSIASPGVDRITSVEFLVRFLMTESLSTLALTLAPVFDLNSKIRMAKNKLFPTQLIGKFDCVACGNAAVSACLTEPCGHFYCFYCIKSEQLSFNCGKCGTSVTSFKPARSFDSI